MKRTALKTTYLLLFTAHLPLVIYGFTTPAVNVDTFRIYLQPDGNDTNSGLTPTDAILTLEAAEAILESEQPDMDIEIHIGPGYYYPDTTVVWRYTNGNKITFTALNYTKDRPVFDGQGKEKWFLLMARNGE